MLKITSLREHVRVCFKLLVLKLTTWKSTKNHQSHIQVLAVNFICVSALDSVMENHFEIEVSRPLLGLAVDFSVGEERPGKPGKPRSPRHLAASPATEATEATEAREATEECG